MSRADGEAIPTMTAITGFIRATATVPTPEVLRRGDFDRMERDDWTRKMSCFGTALILDSVICLLCVPSLKIM